MASRTKLARLIFAVLLAACTAGAGPQDDLESIQRQDHRDVRFFFAMVACLREGGDQYTSLGQIVDYVKRNLDRGFTTREVHARLEAYVHLQLLQHDPADMEQYRLAVPIPVWAEENVEHMERILQVIFPLFFEIKYQKFVGAHGAGYRAQFYEIPESRRELFVEASISGYRTLIARLDELEAELQNEDPDGPRIQQALLFLTGRTSQDIKTLIRKETPDDQT